MLKEAPSSYLRAFAQVADLIGYPRRETKVVAIEGLPSAGKTSFASWLSWQTGMPSVHLDLFIEPSSGGDILWRTQDLARVLTTRLARDGSPLLVEGVFCLRALELAGIGPDWVIFVDNTNNQADGPLERMAREAYATRAFQARIDAQVAWEEPDGKTLEMAAEDLVRFKATLPIAVSMETANRP